MQYEEHITCNMCSKTTVKKHIVGKCGYGNNT
jgi:ribosomal protein L37E